MKQQTRTKLAKLERQRAQLDKQISTAKKHIAWKCPVCESGTQVRFLDLKVMKFYVEPYG